MASNSSTSDADSVKASLTSKLSALIDASDELTQAFAGATQAERATIAAEQDANDREQSACQKRIEDIDAMTSFTRPGAVDEQALLDAIAAVSALVNTSASVNAVVTAADNLVRAYTAKGTQAAA